MFQALGWSEVKLLEEADLIQFTGGADVSPSLYKQEIHPLTYATPERDRREQLIFNVGLSLNKPMAGICRGGQFLNVMCGGKMHQDVDGHTTPHYAVDVTNGEQFIVSSTHHQEMIPGKGAQILVVASEAKKKEKMGKVGHVITHFRTRKEDLDYVPKNISSQGSWKRYDVEVVAYPKYRVLCFQPHPEFAGEKYKELAERYEEYLEQHCL